MAQNEKSLITIREIREYKDKVTSSREEATNFLKRAGIIDSSGKLSTAYRKDKKSISYRYDKVDD